VAHLDNMPLTKGGGKKSVGKNIKELHKGPQYKKTKAKLGAKTANKQAIAVALKTSRQKKRR
jgi:hypothetical protein